MIGITHSLISIANLGLIARINASGSLGDLLILESHDILVARDEVLGGISSISEMEGLEL